MNEYNTLFIINFNITIILNNYLKDNNKFYLF